MKVSNHNLNTCRSRLDVIVFRINFWFDANVTSLVYISPIENRTTWWYLTAMGGGVMLSQMNILIAGKPKREYILSSSPDEAGWLHQRIGLRTVLGIALSFPAGIL
jgi:hypothetical protein